MLKGIDFMADRFRGNSIILKRVGSLLVILILACTMLQDMGCVVDAASRPRFAKTRLDLYVGSSYRFKIKGCTWKSSKKNIVTVSKKGKIKAKKPGTSKITAAHKKSGKKASCVVRVGKYVKSLKVTSASTIILMPGQKSRMKVVIAPKTVLYKDVIYASSDEKVATVAKDGTIAPVANGTARVMATTKAADSSGNNISRTITVVVSGYTDNNIPEPTGIETDIPKMNEYDVIVVPPSRKPSVSPGVTDQPQKPTAVPDTTNIPDGTSSPGASTAPASTPTPVSSPDPTRQPATVKDYINNFKVDPDSPFVDSLVVRDSKSGDMKTLYFLNKDYKGTARITVDGYSYSNSTDVVSFLDMLTTERGGGSNSAGTIRVYRQYRNEKWQISLLKTVPMVIYYLEALKDDTLYNSPYGLIIADGNTLEHISVTK